MSNFDVVRYTVEPVEGDDQIAITIHASDGNKWEYGVPFSRTTGRYTFDWNGRRSTETCAQPGKAAEPGGYWAEAALIGADVHRAYFDVT